MFILDYGLMAKYANVGEKVIPLEDGVPEGESILDKVILYYNGEQFAILKENSDHILCELTWRHPAGKHYSRWAEPITIEKNRLFKEKGRHAVILSNILFVLVQKKSRGPFFESLKEKLYELITEHFEYLFETPRNEEDV